MQGATYVARLAGIPNAISMDMGGTSTDVSLTHEGAARIATVTEIASLPVKVPVTDIVTIGAGGGSIAWIADNGARGRPALGRRRPWTGLLRPAGARWPATGTDRDRRPPGAGPAADDAAGR